jgi:hypothetical protein
MRLNGSSELIDELKALSAALDAQTAAEQVRRTTVAAVGHALEAPAETPSRDEVEGRRSDAASRDTRPDEPIRREVTLILVRWTVMTLAVIVVVLAVTLIGEWR